MGGREDGIYECCISFALRAARAIPDYNMAAVRRIAAKKGLAEGSQLLTLCSGSFGAAPLASVKTACCYQAAFIFRS